MDNKCFIKTSDEHTAILLREAGLPELAKEGNKWVFVNDHDNVVFSSDENKKMFYTNKLSF